METTSNILVGPLMSDDPIETKRMFARDFAVKVHPLYVHHNWFWSKTLEGDYAVPTVEDIEDLTLQFITQISDEARNDVENKTYPKNHLRASGRIAVVSFEWSPHVINIYLQP